LRILAESYDTVSFNGSKTKVLDDEKEYTYVQFVILKPGSRIRIWKLATGDLGGSI
jgi:hypothetical protein